MLASPTRVLLRVAALLSAALGVVFVAAPDWAASEFPWSVTPLTAMTIGGWSIGNGMAAWLASGRGPSVHIRPLLLYLFVFAAAQLLVTIAFRGAFRFDVALAIPYLVARGALLVAAAFALVELRGTLAVLVIDDDPPLSRTVRGLLAGLAVFVGVLAAGGFVAGEGGLSTTGQIFPEPLTLFSVRAFAAFYLALASGIVVLVLRPTIASSFTFGIFGLALIVPILGAALLNLDAFDLAARPLGLLYLGAYIVVAVPAVGFLWRHRDLA